MSSNTTTVVPTYQFQNDCMSYSNISHPREHNNEISHYPHQNPANMMDLTQQHFQQTYPITYPNFNNYDINGINNNSYGQKMGSTSGNMDVWQPCEPSHSTTSQQQTDPCAQVVQVLQCYHQGGEEPEFVRKAIESLVKKLKDKRNELDALISAVTNGGKEPTICVTIQRSLDGRLQVAGRKGVPHVVYARIWRWPNVNKNELQKMDICAIPNDHPDLICINPFHYERIVSSNYGNLDMNITPQTNYGVNYPHNEQPNLVNTYPNTIQQSNGYNQPVDKGLFNNGYIDYFGSTESYLNYPPQQQMQYPPIQKQLPLSQTKFFMYGISQQPNFILKHYKDGRISLINNTLPSFSNDNNDWKRQYYNSESNPLVIDRYNAIRQRQDSENIPNDDTTLSDWCSINYYELDTQIGETFHVPFDREEITIDGGTDPGGSRNGRFCLGALSNVHRTEASERARAGIGMGIKLLHLNDGSVILECNSLKDVFVRSYYLDFENNLVYGSTVHKFESGTSKKVFDLRWASVEMSEQSIAAKNAYAEQAQAVAGNPHMSMVDHSIVSIDDLRRVCCTVAISFVKGWGAGYNRTSLKDTPCWVELQLHRPLKLLNRVLQA